MIFTENMNILIIALFFATYFLFFVVKKTKPSSFTSLTRSKFIAISSIFFYATWYPPAIFLLLYHAALGYFGGKKISNGNKINLLLIVFLALAPLLFFKYFNFFIEIFLFNINHIDFILPLGISFYTFSMVGYYIDIYSKRLQANQSFLEILLFISFWPHLAAGPVLRAKNIFNNVFKEEPLNKQLIALALVLIASGIVKKLLIADNIGSYVNWNISYGVESMSILDAWSTMLGFAVQIYADFSGYSDMAIGFALLMGFKLPANFNYPYTATSVTEFWHRWHISLSTWFRDYIYIPLGGNRNGTFIAYLNIIVVLTLSGIWHGVGWSFLVWGALHGFLLVLEKIFNTAYLKISTILRWFITITLITILWSFFRLNFYDAITIIQKMFGFHDSLFFSMSSPYYVAVILLMLIFPLLDHFYKFYQVDSDGYPIMNTKLSPILVLSILLTLAFTFSGSPLPFIYFDF